MSNIQIPLLQNQVSPEIMCIKCTKILTTKPIKKQPFKELVSKRKLVPLI